jgi:glycosyltransferase involved in cell wall biosynthesis
MLLLPITCVSYGGKPVNRLAFLTTGLAYGGAETQLVHLATQLKARGWEVCIISITPPMAFVEQLEGSGIWVVSLETTRKHPTALLRAYVKTVRLLRSWRPEILHCHMVHANLLGRATRLLCQTPVLISTAHNIYEGGKLREIAYRLTDPLTDLTTFVSLAGAERYLQIGAVPRHKPGLVIPNGVDTGEFCPNLEARMTLRRNASLDNHFVWLSVGRLEEQKNYTHMLQAFAQVVPEYPDAILLIAGEGPLSLELEVLAKRLGLNERAHFLGIRKDVPELMNAADAYIMSSSWEGMPMVLLEASATELPIVATSVGGNREVVVDNESGFLVPAHNPEALARAMRHTMSLPEAARKRMGEAGRRYVEQHYSLEHVIDRWEDLYTELLQKKGLL